MGDYNKIPRSVTFKANYWFFEEVDNRILIHVGGMTREQETVYVIIEGFTPFVYLQLPDLRDKQRWTNEKVKRVFEHFRQSMGPKGPISYVTDRKFSLYGLDPMNVICMNFNSTFHARGFALKCQRSRVYIAGVGNFNQGELKVHEHNIDLLVKYSAIQNISFAGWLTVKESLIEEDENLSIDDRRFTSSDIDMYVDWKDVTPAEDEDLQNVVLKPKYCSFDIETYSDNHDSKIPNPCVVANEVFQISTIFGRLREGVSNQKKILLSLYDPLDIKGVEIRRFKTEKDLLLEFRDLISDEDPDLMIGYNIMKFDWDYLIKRAKINGIKKEFSMMSRQDGVAAAVKTVDWGSSAYGKQAFSYYNCHGRLTLDILLEVERNYKLSKYSLNFVARKFLGKGKDPITARQMFVIVKLTQLVKKILGDDEIPSPKKLYQLRVLVEKTLIVHICDGITLEWRKNLLKASAKKFHKVLRKGITMVGKYCVKDTELPVELENTLNLLTTMEETSNIVHVPMDYIHTRGQQIKVLSQIYRETLANNIVIPFFARRDDKVDENYQGAVVIEVNPGDYNNVVTEDFASLYPNTMRSYNICYTTLRQTGDNDPENDDKYFEITWEDHKNCEHDPGKKGGAKKKVLCGKYCYHWSKPTYKIDENGKVIVEGVGLVPRLLGKLLEARSKAKKQMAYYEARLKMQRGKATDDDISFYKRCNWEILEPGSLPESDESLIEIKVGVYNAKQLALKVSANSVYGITGARKGYIPFIPAAASITAMGRHLIIKAIKEIIKKWPETKLVYGDTDSCMLRFDGADVAQSWKMGEITSSYATHFLKCYIIGVPEDTKIKIREREYMLNEISSDHEDYNLLSDDDKILLAKYEDNPTDLEFENLYKRFLLLTKKKYAAYSCNKDGKIIGYTKKGIVLTRRDNCEALRDLYDKCLSGILDEREENFVIQTMYDGVRDLFTRQIPETKFLIYMGVKSVIEYAKKKEITNKNGAVLATPFIDSNGDPIEDVMGWNDPRLIYKNIPQCLLCLKILGRGEEIPPNTRLEFIYIQNKDAKHQGDKAEDYTYYKDNKIQKGLKPDYLHYLEKQLCKPVAELLRVKYSKDIVIYKDPQKEVERLTRNIKNEVLRKRVISTKRFIKTRLDPLQKSDGKKRTYIYSGFAARVVYILESAKKTGVFEIKEHKHNELIKWCKKIHAKYVLEQIYRHFGMTKRREIKPTNTAEKLPERSKIHIAFLTDYKDVKTGKIISKGTLGITIGRKENDLNSYNYAIKIEGLEGMILENVPRRVFSPYHIKDSDIMKNMFEYRKTYSEVVNHLNVIFLQIRNDQLIFDD